MYLISKRSFESYEQAGDEVSGVQALVYSELYNAGYGIELLEVELVGVE